MNEALSRAFLHWQRVCGVCVLGASGKYGNKERFVRNRECTGMLSVYHTSLSIITLNSTQKLFYFQDFFFFF